MSDLDEERFCRCLALLDGMHTYEAVPTLAQYIAEVSGVECHASVGFDPHEQRYWFGDMIVTHGFLESIIRRNAIGELKYFVEIVQARNSRAEERRREDMYARFLEWEPEPPRTRWQLIDEIEAEDATHTFEANPREDNEFTPDALSRLIDKVCGISKRGRENDGRLKEGNNKMIDDFLKEYQAK